MFQPAQTPVTARTAGSCGWPVTPGLYPAFRRRKLHIPHFRPKGRKLAHSTAPPLPTEPACAGLRRGPHFVLRRVLESGPNSLQISQVGQGLPLSSHRAHSPSQAGTRGFLWGPSQALFRLRPLPLFLQLVHLLLVITVQRHLDGEDGVLVVAVPFHAVAVQIAGVFHRFGSWDDTDGYVDLHSRAGRRRR